MKGNITLIRKVRTEFEQELGYEAIIEFDTIPNLKLGLCDIKIIC